MQPAYSWPLAADQIPSPPAPLDDAALARAAAGADGPARAAAFSALYTQYVDRVYAYLRAHTNNREDTADLTQQVFLQALAALPRYRSGSAPFAAWLFRIARNCLAGFHRRTRVTVAWDLLPIECHPFVDDAAPTQVLLAEDRVYLRTLLEPLPLDTREMLALRFAAGLSAAEIAAVLGKREGAVKKRLTRAMHTLKERSHAIDR
ncbi:MAG TPA: RNA polymerase sigma factor [Chloroflexota bacterium]|nr:RNA polymerase sigma factor [Chloroflexota bacterium]